MLETERIIFRKYCMDDLDFLLTMTSDPEVMKYIGKGTVWGSAQTEKSLRNFINGYQLGDGIGLRLAIRKDDGLPIGHAGLISQVIEDKQETEVGYWIAQEHWGKGYASESAAAWRDYGMNIMGKSRLVSIIQFGNKPSIQVAIKNGMTFERTINYKSLDVALYSISALNNI